jgi:hypothetical protein
MIALETVPIEAMKVTRIFPDAIGDEIGMKSFAMLGSRQSGHECVRNLKVFTPFSVGGMQKIERLMGSDGR